MANPVREYFDAKVPVAPGEGRPPAPPMPSWRQGWTQLSRALFFTLPNQLDRTRVNRNRFIRAVR